MTDPRSALDAWNAVLAEMEEGLTAVEMRLVSGRPIPMPDPFIAPDDLPPLPRSLARRAAAVLARSRRVEEEIAARAEATRRQLAAAEQQHAEQRPMRPAFFDSAF